MKTDIRLSEGKFTFIKKDNQTIFLAKVIHKNMIVYIIMMEEII